MGIFSSLFGDLFKTKTVKSSTSLVNLFTPYFSSIKDPSLNDTYMSAINTHASHISKIKPFIKSENGKSYAYLERLLSVKPNPFMEAGAFWEKVARTYYIENNVFIYVEREPYNLRKPIKAFWILDISSLELRRTDDGEFIFKFLIDGREVITTKSDIIHLARHVDASSIFGGRSNAIAKVIQIINTNYDGIEEAIKQSAFLRFVINSTTMLDEEDRKEKAEAFAANYLTKDGTGIAFLDASSELTQVNSEAKYANADEMKLFEGKILRYLNISDAIIASDYNEDQWQSYYETNIETFLRRLKNELNSTVLTNRQYELGIRIGIDDSDMQMMSTKTKINLIGETKELGMMTINEYREMLNLPELENGDKRLVSLNYIDEAVATKYQLNKKVGDNDED